MFFSISNFRNRLAGLLKVKKGVYANVANEIKSAFNNATIQDIRSNRDMILIDDPVVFIKLRLPDTKHHLSKKDGYRLIYLVHKINDVVVFLDIYPKNGPLQQIDLSANQLIDLSEQYATEAENGELVEYPL